MPRRLLIRANRPRVRRLTKRPVRNRQPLNKVNFGKFALTGIPDRIRMRFRYQEAFFLNTAGLGIAKYQTFRGNSIFDPDFTGIGHQPMFHDQMAGLYRHYMVQSCTIKVTMVADADSSGAMVVVWPDVNSATPNPINAALERPRSKSVILSAASSKTITMKINSRTLLTNWDRSTMALTGTNPTDPWFWHIGQRHVNDANDTIVNFKVDIIYDTILLERIPVAQS